MGYKNIKLLLFILILIGIDQIGKIYALNFFQESVYITDFFRLVLVKNTGIAFSIPMPRYVLLGITAFILIFGTRYFFQLKNKTILQKWGGVFFLGGAAGNFIDRIIYSSVIDFISFWSFPIFNLADVFISGGVIFLLFDEIYRKEK